MAGKPGIENMRLHAPTPLTASGLDMRVGYPAITSTGMEGEMIAVPKSRAPLRRKPYRRETDDPPISLQLFFAGE